MTTEDKSVPSDSSALDADISTLFSAADIEWRQGVPVARNYDDPYYSFEGGAAESQFNFIAGNALSKHWAGRNCFTIGETGFGTALNLAVTLQTLAASNTPPKRLQFFSFERHPLSATDIRKALKIQGIEDQIIDAIASNIPPPLPGFHLRQITDKVTLSLYYGEALEATNAFKGRVDAWFLDGFAPARNPAMWRDEVFKALAEKSASGATFATFTAAGFVKRGLIKAGFDVQKSPGFGRKRERLIGQFKATSACVSEISEETPHKDIAIIGAGIAGLSLAWSLNQRGITPTVYKFGPAASETPIAMLAPKLPLNTESPRARLIARAYAYALQWEPYQNHFAQPIGLTQIANDEAALRRMQKMAQKYGWSESWIRVQASGLFYPNSGGIKTNSLLKRLEKNVDVRDVSISRLVEAKTGEDGSGIELWGNHDIIARHQLVVIAAPLPNLLPPTIEDAFKFTPGRTAWVPANSFVGIDSRATMQGAYASTVEEFEGQACRLLGATRDTSDNELPNPVPQLLDKLGLQNTDNAKALAIWRGVRAEISDHLPLIGPLQKNALYIATGFGSRGFQYAPLMMEMLAGNITEERNHFSDAEWNLLSPQRKLPKRS